MYDDDLFPLMRRSLGSAIVTGASGASMALAFARPAATDALSLAFEAAVDARKAALQNGREGLRQARAAGRPAIDQAFAAKDGLRRRAMGTLPPAVAEAAESLRRQIIEGEKLAYYGTKRISKDLEPARELAWSHSQNMLAQAVHAFGDVAEVALATSLKFGEDLQRGDFEPPKPRAKAARTPKKSAARKRAAR